MSRYHRRLLAIAGGVALVLSCLGGASAANAAPPSTEEQLLQLNPGVTRSELQQAADAQRKGTGKSRDSYYAQVLKEARASAARANGGATHGAGLIAHSSGGSIKRTLNLGAAREAGDLFVAPAATGFVKHGHTGIFSSKSTFVHAPGLNKKSGTVRAATFKVSKNTFKMEVRTTSKKRKAAGKYAFDKLRSKAYNPNFAINRNPTGRDMNCSQLVWAAYKQAAKIDIDFNKGQGVYPYDFVLSKLTKTYKIL